MQSIIDRGAVLVTGASSGMGRSCALRLVRGGYRVFAAVRKERDAESIREEGISGLQPVILDVTDVSSISRAAQVVGQAMGETGLAGLVNNAGIAVTGPVELVPLDEFRRQFEVNLFGQVAVTQAFLPLIRTARGRIVNVGSVGAKFALPFASPLNASKAAFELTSDALRMELRPWGIHVALICPGSIKSGAEKKLEDDSEKTLETYTAGGLELYGSSYRSFVLGMLRLEARGVGPEVMAEAVFHAISARMPKLRYPVGPKSRLLPFLFGSLPMAAADTFRLRLFGVR